MIKFVDFETEGLNGSVTEACAIDEYGQIIEECNGENFEEFMCSIIDSGDVIVFWHNFMPIYLSIYKTHLFNRMKGKFVTFIDFYSIFDGLKQPRYSIKEITNNLTGRIHQGNAKQDALDLYECYQKMK